jgi:hypothetical protein
MKTLVVALLLAVALPLRADAPPPDAPRALRFAKGQSQTTVNDGVVRGERRTWRFGARAGQQATLEIRSLENNAVFEVWQPGARRPAAPGEPMQGQALPGAGEGDEATRWSGALPADGEYLVVVGATRGNASYRLTLRIEPVR